MPVDDPVTGDAVDAGAVFKAKRNALGLSVQEVAHSLKLTARLVEAIEANNRQRFPPTVYLRGFVRNYAKLLELDPEPLVDAYPLAAPAPKEQSAAGSRRRPMRSLRQRLPQTIQLPLSLSVPLPVVITAVGLTLTGLVLFLLLFWLSPASLDLFAIGTESTPASSETVSAVADPTATDGDRHEPVARRDSPIADEAIPETANREEVIPQEVTPQEAVGQEAVGQEAVGQEAAAGTPGAEAAAAGDADPGAGADGNLFPPGIFRGSPPSDAEDSGTGAPPAQPGIEPGAASGVAAGGPGEPLAAGDLQRVQRITPVGTEELWFEFTDDCWVEIYDTEGSSLYQDLLRRRQSVRLIGRGPFQIRLGYAPGVTLAYNGEPVPLGPHTRNNVASLVLGQ